ncbi:hypothetical protein chiPu_0021208 [Chiloscyllium punctatum]|uniref:Uncharacterized protein n=1 Tax=Chiloscyllium punctatum TaxID=137246 RepID=A0A401RPA6_CHIPU|nr:hypothetical protein [Chiloscyllium punctatum]
MKTRKNTRSSIGMCAVILRWSSESGLRPSCISRSLRSSENLVSSQGSSGAGSYRAEKPIGGCVQPREEGVRWRRRGRSSPFH